MGQTSYPELKACMLAVAVQVMGEPNSAHSRPDEKRWGTNGSFSVDTRKGTWYSHERAEGGGVLEFLRQEMGLDTAEAWDWLIENKHVEPKPQSRSNSDFNVVATYDYVHASGELVAQVCRMDPKTFRQRRPHPDKPGKWVWNTAGLQLPIYRLPEVLDGIRAGKTVYVAEGEKGADALRSIGLVATCSPGGAGKWKPHHTTYLGGADVVLLPDNDEPGRKHVELVAKALSKTAKRVRTLALPGLPDKGDTYDWVQAGGTAEQIEQLVEALQPDKPPQKPDAEPPLIINGYPFTEDGIALAFAASHQDNLRYDHTRGSWFIWTGKAWRQDETRHAFSWARRICREMNVEAAKQDKGKISLSKAATASAVERFAIADESLSVTSVIWDSDIYLMGTPDGTVDLKTGMLRDPEPHDFITKLTAVSPAASPDCPIWLEFLEQVTAHDAGLIRFLRQWCGYCLTGDTREQALVFAYGPGGNGKGVFLNTVSKIMGDYCRNAAMETFTSSATDKHPTDLAMLRGARLVTASETEEGRAWAESRIKQMTGGDKITARFMRQDFFEYFPQFKLTMIGNHKPLLRNVGDAEKRRFNMVPFLFKPNSPDHQLEEKLKAEWPAILRWMIEGCLDWRQNGLVRPKVLKEATEEYFSEQDTVTLWMEECCKRGPNLSETLDDLFKSWSAYALANGEKPGATKWFSQTLVRAGFNAVKHTPGDNKKRGFVGVGLIRVKPKDYTQSQSQNEDDYPPGYGE